MTLDEWIEYLKRYVDVNGYGGIELDGLDCIEIWEFLEELKRYRERGEDGKDND
jgi:hypothetical protein